jgi:acetyl-CoA carboxylase carboxyl transferase subunit alpha
MMRYSVFSVISPEGCSAILWNDPAKAEAATNAMKITSGDLKELNLIDDVIAEPLIGAHRDRDAAAAVIADYFLTELSKLRKMSNEERMEARYKRLVGVGAYSE